MFVCLKTVQEFKKHLNWSYYKTIFFVFDFVFFDDFSMYMCNQAKWEYKIYTTKNSLKSMYMCMYIYAMCFVVLWAETSVAWE